MSPVHECHLFISPVISDPKTTVLQVISSTKVAKYLLSFHSLTSGRMVEVNQLRKKKFFFIILGRIKQKTKQMLLKGGVATPSTPPLDPPMHLKTTLDQICILIRFKFLVFFFSNLKNSV